MQIDIQVVAVGVRSDHDLVDERANAAHRLFLRRIVGETLDELLDSGAIALAHAGLDPFGFCVDASEFGLNCVASFDGGV